MSEKKWSEMSEGEQAQHLESINRTRVLITRVSDKTTEEMRTEIGEHQACIRALLGTIGVLLDNQEVSAKPHCIKAIEKVRRDVLRAVGKQCYWWIEEFQDWWAKEFQK